MSSIWRNHLFYVLFPSLRFNMGFSIGWICFAVLSCLLCMGGEVWCDCPNETMQIERGRYTLTKGLKAGSMMTYHCDEGYYPYPDMTRLCKPSGKWDPPHNRQRCKRVTCPDPLVLEHGSVYPTQEYYFVGDNITFECYSGYKLIGSENRVCLPNTKWSGSTTICSHSSEPNCGNPGIPPGASRTGNSFDFDDRVQYTCNGDLFLVGSPERVCTESGFWTGTEPQCYYKHTYDTTQEVSEAFGNSLKDSFTVTEPTGDIQEERRIRISKNGTLNIYIIVDTSSSIDPEHVTFAKMAVVELINKISSLTVTPNYEILFFSMNIYEAVNILDFFNATSTKGTMDLAAFSDFVIDGMTEGTNMNLAFETILEKMSYIKTLVGKEVFKEHRHAVIAFSDGGYNMGGSPEVAVKKIKNMVYMGDESRKEHLDIYVFGIGSLIFDQDLQLLTVGTGDKHYFRLNTTKDLYNAFDDIIDEEAVMDLCGLYKPQQPIFNYRRQFPWVAFISIQSEQGERKCLGSLVSKRFVLTAAHCFKFDDVKEMITVEFGVTDDENPGKMTKYEVENFILHEKYNVGAKKDLVKEFYDFDLALIELKVDIQIGVKLRPICIPCTVETRDALKLSADSTCKDQENFLLATNKEELSFLTKDNKEAREKTVHAKLGAARDECIEHALKAKGIVTNDPKEAVTDNMLCTGGDRDQIACKGDSGGGVFKNFRHRTIQVAVVSWGTVNMCNDGGLQESYGHSRDFHINLFRAVPFLKSVLGKDVDRYEPLVFLD